MDDQRTQDPVRILRPAVRVIPVGSILAKREVVDKRLALRDATLRDTDGPVKPVGAVLEDAVPMHASRVATSELVGDVDDQPVAHVGFDQGAGELSVDEQHVADHP